MNERLERITQLVSPDGITKLQNAKVAVVGLGGVGGEACIALARSGVGTLIIQDFDVVNLSNYNRQVIANDKTLGLEKTKAMSDLIKSINPYCNVIILNERFNTNSNLFNLSFDYLIDAIDSVDEKVLLIKTCLKTNKIFISSMGTAKKMDLKKLDIIDISKTAYDPLARVIRKKLHDDNIFNKFPTLCSTEVPQSGVTLGSYICVTATAGLMIADFIIKKILEN